MISQLERKICDVTGFKACIVHPHSGSISNDCCGFVTIRNYLFARDGDYNRNVCLLPSSVDDNVASSVVLAGLKAIFVKCDSRGNIDLKDLNEKAEKNAKNLACIVMNYPSSQDRLRESARIIHKYGGCVFMNSDHPDSQIKPAEIGVDVCHLKLHKSYGPIVDPSIVCCNSVLAPYLTTSRALGKNTERSKFVRYLPLPILGVLGLAVAIRFIGKKEKKDWDWLKKLYDGVIAGKIPGMVSPEDLAEQFKKQSSSIEGAARALLIWQNTKNAIGGFVTGLPGLTFLPLTIPANVASTLAFLIQTVATIACLGGYDLHKNSVKSLVLKCLIGESANAMLRPTGINVTQVLARGAVNAIPRSFLGRVNAMVGAKLFTKFSSKGILQLGRSVPILGGVFGGVADYYYSNKIGNEAINRFIKKRCQSNV